MTIRDGRPPTVVADARTAPPPAFEDGKPISAHPWKTEARAPRKILTPTPTRESVLLWLLNAMLGRMSARTDLAELVQTLDEREAAALVTFLRTMRPGSPAIGGAGKPSMREIARMPVADRAAALADWRGEIDEDELRRLDAADDTAVRYVDA